MASSCTLDSTDLEYFYHHGKFFWDNATRLSDSPGTFLDYIHWSGIIINITLFHFYHVLTGKYNLIMKMNLATDSTQPPEPPVFARTSLRHKPFILMKKLAAKPLSFFLILLCLSNITVLVIERKKIQAKELSILPKCRIYFWAVSVLFFISLCLK